MAAKDYYRALGIKRDASAKDVQTSYRRLARKFHPDVTGGDKAAEEKFKGINEAYEVLSDTKKRAAYDKWGERWEQAEQLEQMQRKGQFSGFERGGGGPMHFEFGGEAGPFGGGGVFDDVGGGGFGQVFDRLFRSGAAGGGGAQRRSARGQDIEQKVIVTLAEAFTGSTRTLQLQTQEPCAICQGSGSVGDATCHGCQGTGLRAAGTRLEVKIPIGVTSGTKIRLRGKGGPGSGGAAAGDVVLVVDVAEDARFERRGAALHTDVAVPLTTAVLGGEVSVATLSGSVALRIPEGTQNGQVFRLTGRGMPIMKQDKRGELFAKVRVVLPEQIDDEQRALFEQLRGLGQGAASAAPSAGPEAGPSVGASDSAAGDGEAG